MSEGGSRRRAPVRWPGHAYVPGQTERHPEGAFDALRETARDGLDPAGLARSEAFRHGLLYLDEGYFWEAHELLEPVWMRLPEGGPERRLVQCLIQVANGLLKLRMRRPKAALRLADIARDLLPGAADAGRTGDGFLMGVDLRALRMRINSLRAAARDAI